MKRWLSWFVIACFGDPGLDAARELADRPVGGRGGGDARGELPGPRLLGGHDTGPDGGAGLGPRRALRDEPVLPQRARLRDPCARTRGPASDAFAAIVAESRRAVADDGAEAIVLDCAGMADLAARMTEAVWKPPVHSTGTLTACLIWRASGNVSPSIWSAGTPAFSHC